MLEINCIVVVIAVREYYAGHFVVNDRPLYWHLHRYELILDEILVY